MALMKSVPMPIILTDDVVDVLDRFNVVIKVELMPFFMKGVNIVTPTKPP